MSTLMNIFRVARTAVKIAKARRGQGEDFIDGPPMDIEDIMELNDPEKFSIEIDEYLDKKTNYGDDLSVISEEAAKVFFVEQLQMEVNNGGFDQFFFNSSGNNWRKTLDALKEMGADKTAELLKKAAEAYGCDLPENRRLRHKNMENKANTGYEEVLEELDSEFYEYEDDIDQLIYDYCMKHRDKFLE